MQVFIDLLEPLVASMLATLMSQLLLSFCHGLAGVFCPPGVLGFELVLWHLCIIDTGRDLPRVSDCLCWVRLSLDGLPWPLLHRAFDDQMQMCPS